MIIENTEALRDWLTKYLEPLCDADPIALAKYVMALIKKDKPEKDLKTICLDQLEVFLQKETITFVDTLFETIANKCYLKTTVNPNPTITTPPTNVSKTLATDQTLTVPTETAPVVVKSPEIGANNNNNNVVTVSNSNRSTEPHISSNSQTTNKSDSTHESSHRIRDQNKRNRSRSRSRSPLRNQRRNEFDSRRLGPIPNRNNGNNYFNDDRRNRRGQPNRRAGNQRFGGYRNDRNERDYRRPRDMKRNRSRSRSRSYSSDSSRSRSRSRSWSPRDRERESPLNKKSRPSSRPGSRSPSPSKTTQKDGEKSKKCRDYEEKGFCLKGHLCPYDHGTDPVVLDSNVSAALGFTNNTGPANAPLMPIPNSGVATNPPNSYLAEPYNPEAPGMDPQRPHPPQGPPPPMGPRMPPPYWAPPMPMRGPLPPRPLPPPQFIPPPGRPRELIGVPTIDNNLRHPHSNRTVIEPSMSMGHRGGIRGGLMKHGRGGYRNVRRINNESADRTCLEVRKIPANLNTISHLNQHFSKFGTIVNLQVCHEGDPEAALVQYTTNAEASAAIRSSEAVLANRFIKVFWHSKELQQKHEQEVKVETTDENETTPASGGSAKVSIKDRLGPKVNETESVLTAVNSSGTISRTVFDPSKLKKNNTNINNNQKDNTNANQTNNNQTDVKNSDSSAVKNKSPMTDKTNKKQITSKQCKLLEEMIKNQKQLMAKLEKSTNDNEKKNLKEMIDSVANKIKSINENIKQVMSQKTVKKPQTRDELMAEILNTDLDMFVKMQNKDVSYVELANKIAKLKRKEKTFGIRGRGVRSYPRHSRGRGLMRRGSFQYGGRLSNPSLKVDRRTRKLLIPDINEDDITDLLEHLAQFSDVEVIEPSSNGAVVTFKTRTDAEKAIQNISQIKFKENFQLSYSWFDENIAKSLDKKSSNKTISTEPKSENETNDREIETLEEELLDYEEDDTEDESEARNWKA